MQQNMQTIPQQQARQAPVFIPGNPVHHSPAQPQQQQQQSPHVPVETTPKKKDKTPVSKQISNPVKISAPASTTPAKSSPEVATAEKKQDDSDKANTAAKANAAFAAQVLANLQKVIIFIFFICCGC